LFLLLTLLSSILIYPIATEKGQLRAGAVVATTGNKKEQASVERVEQA
jgi:hypothetical protein